MFLYFEKYLRILYIVVIYRLCLTFCMKEGHIVPYAN